MKLNCLNSIKNILVVFSDLQCDQNGVHTVYKSDLCLNTCEIV